MPVRSAAYEDDFYTWTRRQAAALRQAASSRINLPEPLDFENLAEEIESLGVSQLRELYSRYTVLLHHLLKWQYQPDHRSPSWNITISTQRNELVRLLRLSPGLKPKRRGVLTEVYADARKLAAIETKLPLERLPLTCPYALDQVESDDFWPGEPSAPPR